jgi:NADPH-dependent 2,4-dienoyl-CoA reductase/sulfur reductase-like enzyme
MCDQSKKAVVIGGSFIGSEISSSLCSKGVFTTMVFPGPYICHHLLPPDVGERLTNLYQEKGVRIDNEDVPVAFVKKNGKMSVLTRKGFSFEADILIAGIGIMPNISIAADAGLHVTNGIIVDQYLRSSNPDIFAAGDVALFPFSALNRHIRVEHWDNAVNQGSCAGNNMVSVEMQPYTHIPYFFSDLFEYGYEAIGDVNSELEIFSDWREPLTSGVLYYLSENYVKGVLLWNIWNKKEAAKKLLGQRLTHADLKHAL